MIPHGSYTGYNYHCCRCVDCKEANRRYQQRYRANRGGATLSETRAWRAATLAGKRLKELHPRQYQRLYDEAYRELREMDQQVSTRG